MLELITPIEFTSSDIDFPEVLSALKNLYHDIDIYQRVDHLINLIEACKKTRSNEKIILNLQTSAISMIKIICDSDDCDDAIAKRKLYRDIDSQYLPNNKCNHLTSAEKFQSRNSFLFFRFKEHLLAWKKNYLHVSEKDQANDKRLEVARLDERQREALRVFLAQGKIWQLKQPSDSSERLTIHHLDTTNYIAHSKSKGRAIYVVSPREEFFVSSSEIGKFHHSSILNGHPVLAAGTLEVRDGELTYIDEYSGHYKPTVFQFFNLLRQLKKKLIVKENTVIQLKLNNDAHQSSLVVSNKNYLNTQGFLNSHLKLSKVQSEKQTEQDLSYYQLLADKLFERKYEDEYYFSFIIVMREYLRDQISFKSEFDELQNECVTKDIPDDFVQKYPDLFNQHIESLFAFIKMNFSDGFDTNWLDELKIKSLCPAQINR